MARRDFVLLVLLTIACDKVEDDSSEGDSPAPTPSISSSMQPTSGDGGHAPGIDGTTGTDDNGDDSDGDDSEVDSGTSTTPEASLAHLIDRFPNAVGGGNSPDEQAAAWTGSKFCVWGVYAGGHRGGCWDATSKTWSVMSTTGSPTAYLGRASAVWTSSAFCVWGGDNNPITDVGRCYDPVGNSWTPTSTTNAPAARYQHKAVWLDDEMCVTGGMGIAGVYPTDSGCYTAGSDSWRSLPTLDAPSPRFGHSMTATGAGFCVWGGYYSTTNTILSDGACYVKASDTWTPMSSSGAPSARMDHEGVWTGTALCILGGRDATNHAPPDGGCYDPATDQWRSVDMVAGSTARLGASFTWTGTEVCSWGGLDNTNSSLSEGACYDPSTDDWRRISVTDAPRRDHHFSFWDGTRLCYWGGTLYNNGGGYWPMDGACINVE